MAGIPQVITEDRASGAQFIEGSLKFEQNKRQYLRRTPAADGNRRLWTWSGWLKRNPPNLQDIFSAGQQSTNDGIYSRLRLESDSLNLRQWVNGSLDSSLISSRVFRDTSAFFHFVMIYDIDNSTNTDKVRWYINGQRVTSFSSTDYPANPSWINSSSKTHTIGGHYDGGDNNADSFWDGHMSQVYFLDGIAAGPEEFGFTDPLTNTWRPKKFKHLSTSISTQYSGASALTWDDNPIGSVYTLSNGNRTATASGGSGYTGADVWSNAIPANSTTAWTLDVTNSDNVGGWYFTDSQTASGTHPDERGGNSLGMRGQDLDAGWYGTFATVNGGSNGSHILDLLGTESWGSRRVDFVVYRPASGTGKVWVKPNGGSAWIGGGDPSNTSSTPSFIIPDGNTYFGYTFYDRSNGDQIATFDGDGSIQQKIGANSFYLPLDGNTPIGRDQSGKGNNWEPVKFGGSVELPKATGAIPILNTNGGGTVARNGVRTDKKTYTVTASGGNYYLDGALKPTLNAYRGGSYTFDYTGATSHPFYLSSLPDGKHNSKAYSVEFDGTGDYLGVTGNSDYDFGTGDFTIEGYFYTTNNNGTIASSQNYYSGGSNGNWLIRISSATQLAFASYDGAGNEEYTEFTARYQTNTWHHFAFVRSGTTLTCYLDGSSVGTLTVSKSLSDGSNGILIGEDSANLNPEFNGKISNFRINKGTALYTTNFTPPSTTLTNVTGTTLLCCQDSNATTGAVLPSGSTITANGNAAASNTSPFLYDTNGYYGLNLATSNTTKITIPHWAADTLYYYCNAHSGMGSSINITTDIFKADPYAWKCVLALPLLGSKDDVSASINVNSTTKTTAITGNAESRSDRWDIYSGAFYFDSTADYIEVTPTSGTTLADNTAPYTIEFFFSMNNGRLTDNTYNIMWSTSSGLTIAKWRSGVSNKVYFESDGNATGWNVTSPEDINSIRWYHFAAVRNGNTITTYLDGVRQGTATSTYSASAETWWRVGGQNANSSCHAGYMQDFRIYNGVAKYTEDFSRVSTTPDVLPDTPSGVSGKSNLTKITEGAVAFDGSGDYLRVEHGDMAMGTGDFTVEAFIYTNSHVNYRNYIGTRESGQANPAGWCIASNSGGALYVYSNGLYTNLTTQMATKTWYHVAYTRESGTHKWYVDGVLRGSDSTARDYTDDKLTIGANSYAGSEPLDGFVSNVRVIKGTAVYTSDFTPPAAPLTEVTNTKLLCCQSNTEPGSAAVSPSTSGINDGTNWSHYVTSDSLFRSGFPGSKAFNGTTKSSTNDCAATPQTAGQGFTFTFGGGVPFTTLQMQCDPNGSGGATVKANGVDITSQLTNGSLTNTTITGVTSPLTSLSLVSNSGDAGYLGSVTIDGTMLQDPLTPNGNAAATNFNPFTDDINTIRGQETGYATFNPLQKNSGVSLTNGNLKLQTNNSSWKATQTTIGMKTGKFYWEFGPQLWRDASNHCQPGVAAVGLGDSYEMGVTNYTAFYHYTGTKYINASQSSFGAAWNDSEYNIIGIAFDADTRKVWFSKNGVWQGGGNPSAGTNEAGIINLYEDGTYAPTLGSYGSLNNGGADANFGQKPFKYAPPDGFQPLSLSTVQPEKVFARPDQYIGVTLYTGSGETISPRTIELPHAADLVWVKSRDRSSSHQLADTVRGNNSVLNSNTNMTARNPTTSYNGGGVSIIDGKTISLVKGSTNQANNENLNATGQRGVVWSWKAGGQIGVGRSFMIDDVGYANASDVNMNVGALNSAQFLKGQVWSGLMSVASGSFDQAASRAFDGFLRTDPNRLRTSDNQATVTMNLSSAPVTVSSQIKVHAEPGYNSSCTVTVGGVTHTSSTGALHTFNVSGSLTQMTLQSTQSGGRTYMEGMEIDGKLLVDDNITVNAPSIAPTGCSVGTKQGFSIIKYDATGSNLRVSHGLSERPGFILLKTVHSTSGDWLVWHQSLAGVDRFLKLNDTITQAQADNVFLSIDENTFGTGDDSGINSNGQQKIAYLWHDVPGLQKFGKWTNNNSNDGTFIELGFKPALILLKNTDNVEKWYWIDSSRHPHNLVAPSNTAAGAVNTLQPNTSNTEASSRNSHTNTTVDILSNGFKIRTTNPASGEISFGTRNYIYAAWAEVPGANLYGGQANGR